MSDRCLICENKGNTILNRKKIGDSYFENVECSQCGFVYTVGEEKKLKKASEFLYQGEEYYSKKKYFNFFKKFRDFLIEITELRYANPKSQINFILSHLKKQKQISFLDIGCGFGQTLKYLDKVKSFSEVEGIEMNQSLIKDINKKCKKSVAILVKDIEEFLENNTKKYDIIFMSHVLEHFVSPDVILKKLKNKINANGIVYIEVPNCGNKSILKSSLSLKEHFFHFTQRSIETLFSKKLKFRIIESDFYDLVVSSRGKLNLMKQIWFYCNYFFYRNKDISIKGNEKFSSLLKVLITN